MLISLYMPFRVFQGHAAICTGLIVAGVLFFGGSAAAQGTGQTQLLLNASPTNSSIRIQWSPWPAIEKFELLRSDSIGLRTWQIPTGVLSGYEWSGPADLATAFFRLQATPLDSNAVVAATVLNRLAYGPTPEDLGKYKTDPAAIESFISEQLAPESILEEIDQISESNEFQRVTITGPATSSTLYVYLTSRGDIYLDDISLVAGSVPESGPNLLVNGDFESDLSSGWNVSSNHANSILSSEFKHTGNQGLHLVATAGGSTRTNSVWQDMVPGLFVGQTYTLTYWYLPGTVESTLAIRLSTNGLITRVTAVPDPVASTAKRLATTEASLDDLRAWFVLHAVRGKRQLFEVLTQFFENHFTTQHSKLVSWFGTQYTDTATRAKLATDLEFRELSRWRALLLNPDATFYDFLKVSAESPAMIIYLDTVASRRGAANENYSRELMELHSLGVDNGYTQTDITLMSRCWTGWTVRKLPLTEAANPHATPVADVVMDPGVWALAFNATNHDITSKTLFRNATVPTRFGPPYAGRSYQLIIPARTGTNGMDEGYAILTHLADLPFTQEFIAVKLCQLFVHDDFAIGYDFTLPELSPEARLIRDCLQAWESPAADGRKGNLRAVLRVIFNSSLFRTQSAARQKIRTPLEYVVSSVRALRTLDSNGNYTADTDGFDLRSPMGRMGMNLFDRMDPDGWPEVGRGWIDTTRMVERMRFCQNLLMASTNTLKDADFGAGNDDNVSDPVALIRTKLPPDAWTNAAALVDYFLPILFAGEGMANLDLDRQAAIRFLNTDDSGSPSSFSGLTPASLAYDNRIRGVVALLMSFPRFHEQ